MCYCASVLLHCCADGTAYCLWCYCAMVLMPMVLLCYCATALLCCCATTLLRCCAAALLCCCADGTALLSTVLLPMVLLCYGATTADVLLRYCAAACCAAVLLWVGGVAPSHNCVCTNSHAHTDDDSQAKKNKRMECTSKARWHYVWNAGDYSMTTTMDA